MAEEHPVSRFVLLAAMLVLLYFSFLVAQPFLSYLLFSVILVMMFHRAFMWLAERTGKRRLSASLLVVALILLLVVPSLFIGVKLARQAPQAYAGIVSSLDIGEMEDFVADTVGVEVDIQGAAENSVRQFRDYAVQNVGSFLASISWLVIGLFTMFFAMYYLFLEGDRLLDELKSIVPIKKSQQNKLLKEIDIVVHGIIEGQMFTGIIQGVIAAVAFAILGVPNAVFWGFITILVSILPMVGSFLVWVPIAIWLALGGMYWQAITLTIVGLVVISQIDNVLRPFIMGARANIHPVLVLVGVLGGLRVFGLVGFVLGPLILAMLVGVLRFYRAEFV